MFQLSQIATNQRQVLQECGNSCRQQPGNMDWILTLSMTSVALQESQRLQLHFTSWTLIPSRRTGHLQPLHTTAVLEGSKG